MNEFCQCAQLALLFMDKSRRWQQGWAGEEEKLLTYQSKWLLQHSWFWYDGNISCVSYKQSGHLVTSISKLNKGWNSLKMWIGTTTVRSRNTCRSWCMTWNSEPPDNLRLRVSTLNWNVHQEPWFNIQNKPTDYPVALMGAMTEQYHPWLIIVDNPPAPPW